MEITNEQLEKLRSKLPNGSQAKIADKTGFSQTYVNLVLNGKQPVSDSNKTVITESLRIINANKIENQLISEQLKNL